MASARDDYLLRLIAQAAAALRHLRKRLGGGEAVEAVLKDADAAISELLGPQRAMVERLDPWSAVNLLADAERASAWADLMELEADIRDAQGDSRQAGVLRKRVTDLRGQLVAQAAARGVAAPDKR